MTSWAEQLAVFDLETTGVDVRTARIVTAYVGRLDGTGAVIDQASWLLDPGVDIPPQATAVHGITTEAARNEGMDASRGVAEIAARLRDVLAEGIGLVIYNAPYDLSLLAAECARHGVEPLHDPRPIIDPLVIDRAVDRYRRGKRTLSAACEVYGVTLENMHDAASDAIAAGLVAQRLARAYETELAISAEELHDHQVEWSALQAQSFQEYMRRVKDPAFVANGSWPQR